MNTTTRIKLTFPIKHDGVPIAEIALRRPIVVDRLAAQKPPEMTPNARFG